MPSVTFRLPPTLHERFLAFCEAKDVRPSEMLREAIEKFIDRQDEAESLGHHGPKARDRRPLVEFTSDGPVFVSKEIGVGKDVFTARKLQRRLTIGDVRPREKPGARLKAKK